MLRDDLEGLLLAAAPDEYGDVAGRRRVQLRPARLDDGQRLREGIESLTRGAEGVAILLVVALEPSGTRSKDESARAPLRADVVDSAGHVGLQVRVAVAVAVDQSTDLNAGSLLGEGGEHGPRLEVQAVTLATQREEVIPVEEDVGAGILEGGGRVSNLLERRMLRRYLNADADRTLRVSHMPSLRGAAASAAQHLLQG